MQNILVVVDMQNDFIDGALGTKEAVAIVPSVKEKIQNFQGRVIFTRDTHGENYMDTQEGKKLPVKHCIRNTKGWEIRPEIGSLISETPVDKGTFGSMELGEFLKAYHEHKEACSMLQEADQADPVEQITFIGLCTDICVISNALLAKAFLPEAKILVDAACCAGVTPESHKNALEAMKVCQIQVEHE